MIELEPFSNLQIQIQIWIFNNQNQRHCRRTLKFF
jgi:hypothetical protein